jgi:plasmid stabilization system protein ParE
MDRVEIETTAEADLLGILLHIAETLKEPAIARRIYFSIKNSILTLDEMPQRCKLASDDFFAARGLRRLDAENYSVFFVVDDEKLEVHVLRVLNNRRQWQNFL